MPNQSTFGALARALATHPKRLRTGIALGLFVLSGLVYLRALGFDFVSFDDQTVLLGHPQLYNEQDFPSSLRQIFVEYFPREEPLLIRDLSWAIDARIWGFENPLGYHLGNVLANALAVALLFVFLARTLRDDALAAGISLAFALVPMHVEPVAWAMGRKDLLVSIFMLLALLAQSIELSTPRSAKRYIAYGAGFIFTLLALGSKISAISLFLVLALHRATHGHLECREDSHAERKFIPALGQGLPWLLPHALLSVTVFLAYQRVLSEYGVLHSNSPSPFSAEHLSQVAQFLPLIFGQYLNNLFIGSELSLYYRWPHVAIPLTAAQQVSSVLIACSVFAGVGFSIARPRTWTFFALWPLALMVPYTGLFYVGFWHADRYFYLASAGVLTLAGLGLREFAARGPAPRAAALAVTGLFCLMIGVQTWQQQSRWQNSESLWKYETERRAPSVLSFQALAKVHVQRGEAATTRPEKLEQARAAYVLIERGFARLDELDLNESAYWLPETGQEALLHLLKGRVVALTGAPPGDRLVHFRRAFEIAPDRLPAILLSQSLFMQAGTVQAPERDRLIAESLDVFEEYIRFSARDAQHLEESRSLLEKNYGDRFPRLAGRIEEIRRTYYP